MDSKAIAGCFAGMLAASGFCLSPLEAQEAPTEDESRVVYHGTIGKQSIWMALHETEDGQLAGSYFYEKHRKELALTGRMTGQGRFRLEERVEGRLTGVMDGTRREHEPGQRTGTPDGPPDISGSWSAPDGGRSLPFSLRERGTLRTYRKDDLDHLAPVPADWPVFRAPQCRFTFRHPHVAGELWQTAATRQEWEEEPFPVCRFYRSYPGGGYDEFRPEIAVYRGVDRETVLEKCGFVPFWTTWEVGSDMLGHDVAAVATKGRLHVAWAEPLWSFWQETDGRQVKHEDNRLVAVIEDGESVIYFSSPNPSMWVSHLVRGLLAMEPGQPAPLGEFYTCDGAATIIYREDLSSRSHTTWEGTYAFSDEQVYGIEGLPDLHVFVYAHPQREGNLLDLANDPAAYGGFSLLREANTEVKGVTPIFEGVDVFPGKNEAEIILRWRHPGQGGLRTVEKYRYSLDGIEAIDRSELASPGRRMEWRKGANPAEHTAPATKAPEPRSVGIPETELYADLIGAAVFNPYEWCMWNSTGPTAMDPDPGESLSDYAREIGWHHLLEASADLDGDGVPELLVRPEMAGRVYPIFVFAREDEQFRFVGNFEASYLLRPSKPGAPASPRIIAYEACGGKFGYIMTYELGDAGFRRIGEVREVWSGDGNEEGNDLLARTFPAESVLQWKKVP